MDRAKRGSSSQCQRLFGTPGVVVLRIVIAMLAIGASWALLFIGMLLFVESDTRSEQEYLWNQAPAVLLLAAAAGALWLPWMAAAVFGLAFVLTLVSGWSIFALPALILLTLELLSLWWARRPVAKPMPMRHRFWEALCAHPMLATVGTFAALVVLPNIVILLR